MQIPIQQTILFEFVLCDTEKSEFVDLVDFGDVTFAEETVIDIPFRQCNR